MIHPVFSITTAALSITAAAADVLGEDNYVAPTPWCMVRGDMEHGKLISWYFGVGIAWELITYLSTSFLYLCLKFKMVSVLYIIEYNNHMQKVIHMRATVF